MTSFENHTDMMIKTCQDAAQHGEAFEHLLAGDQVSIPQKQHLLCLALDYWAQNILVMSRGSSEVVRSLINSGANPLVGLATTDQTPQLPAPLPQFIDQHPDIVLHLVNMLYSIKRDTGSDVLSEDGGTVLHTLCGHSPSWLGDALDSALNGSRVRMPPTQTMSLPLNLHLHASWVNFPDSCNQTPLHWLWHRALFDLSLGSQPKAVWDGSEYLRQLGGNILVHDQVGDTPAALMAQAVQSGLPIPNGFKDFDLILAAHHADLLDRQTPQQQQSAPRRSL